MAFGSAVPQRARVVFLTFLAVFVCYIDRVNISVAIIPMAEDLNWDLQTQGLVLSSFALGYITLQIVGGRLADRYGGKAVLGIGVLVWSFFTIVTPPAAALGLTALLMVRILMGMGEAVTFPAFYSLYSKWIPLSERARAVGFSNSAIPVGTAFALIVTPIIVQQLGWQWAFYLFGSVGFFWYVFWHRMVTATPQEHPAITAEELTHIESSIDINTSEPSPHWTTFLRHRAVWAIAVAHFCNNWSLYVLLTWLPTFVNKGLGVDFASVGWVSMIPHVTSFIGLNLAGNIADRLIKSGMPVIRVRKIMMTIGFGAITCALSVVGYAESAWLAIGIMATGNFFAAAVTGGFSVNHMDIAPRHAGTLMGITNTAGTIPGIVAVYISGMILGATGSWTLVFQTAAGITFFGLIFFLLFARGEKIFD
ncbi:MAG: ACS family MFS transporter [Pseudomonadota bacterium]